MSLDSDSEDDEDDFISKKSTTKKPSMSLDSDSEEEDDFMSKKSTTTKKTSISFDSDSEEEDDFMSKKSTTTKKTSISFDSDSEEESQTPFNNKNFDNVIEKKTKIDLNKLKKGEILDLCKRYNIDTSKIKLKSDLINELKKHVN